LSREFPNPTPVSPPAMAATGVARVWTGARRMVAVAAGLPGAVL